MNASQDFLRTDASKEKLDGAIDSLAEPVRSCEIHGPLAHDGVVDPVHEFSQMFGGKGAADFATRLTGGENFPEQAGRCFFSSTHIRGTNWNHRAREHYGLTESPVGLVLASQRLVQTAQPLGCGGFVGKFGLEMLGDAGKAAPANFTQDRILAGEVAEKRGLADFQNPDNILNARVLVTLLAKKPDGGINDLLAQLYFLAFTETEHFPAGSFLCPNRAFLKGGSPAPLGTGHGDGGRIDLGDPRASHDSILSQSEWRAGCRDSNNELRALL